MENAKQFLELQSKLKSKGTAYMLWFFLGGFSAHRFYIGNNGEKQLSLGIIGISFIIITYIIPYEAVVGKLVFAGLTLLTILPWAIWVFIDLFKISSLVDSANNEIINF